MDFTLRPMTDADLPLLTGGDSEFDDFGDRPARVAPLGCDPSEPGGLTILDANGEVCGNVSWIWVGWGPNKESRNPMIGIWLRAASRGQGIGWRAQRELVDILMRGTAANRVEAHTDIENIGEQRALEKAGFTREGVIRGAQWRQGAFHDGYLYSVLRSEWQEWGEAR